MSAPTETPDDKAWLDKAVLEFILSNIRNNENGIPEPNVMETFAPSGDRRSVGYRRANLKTMRPSFGERKRKVQRAMVEASIRRLVMSGRVKIMNPGRTNLHGEWGEYRYIKPISILDALSEL